MTSPRASVSSVVNAMTIDVEDYYHVSVFDGIVPRRDWTRLESRVGRNTERVLGLFREFSVTATFFVLGWVAEHHPDVVKRIAAAGHEIASHGYAHRLAYDQGPVAFREDVRRAKAVLEDATGVAVQGFRAPSYSVTPRTLWALDILIEEGYRYDASIFPIRHDYYGIPLSPRHPYMIRRAAGALLEVPGSTVQVGPVNLPIGGGGYFRILPYAWTRWGIAHVNGVERRPAVFYLHPWELDPDQPRLRAGLLGRFRHYRNLAHTESRLRQLLCDFRFGPLTAVMSDVAALPAGAHLRSPLMLPYVW